MSRDENIWSGSNSRTSVPTGISLCCTPGCVWQTMVMSPVFSSPKLTVWWQPEHHQRSHQDMEMKCMNTAGGKWMWIARGARAEQLTWDRHLLHSSRTLCLPEQPRPFMSFSKRKCRSKSLCLITYLLLSKCLVHPGTFLHALRSTFFLRCELQFLWLFFFSFPPVPHLATLKGYKEFSKR